MRVPKYAHHKATGQAFCKIDGKYIYLGKYNSPESRKRYAALVSGEPIAPTVPPPSLSVLDLIEQFLARNPSEYPPGSKEPRQFPFALTHLAKVCGHLPAADFQAHHLADVRKAMVADGLCREGINRRLARVKLCFRRSELWGLVPSGVYARLAVVRGSDTKALPSPGTMPATFADVLAVVRALRNPIKGAHRGRIRPLVSMLLLQWWTGCRPGEVRIMRACDIDRSGPVWIYRPMMHKNQWRGQTREIVLGRKCQAILSPLLESVTQDSWLFPSRTGEPWKLGAYANAVRKAAKRAGVSLHPYALRHGAKRRIEQSHGEAAAKAFLGQESLDSTRKYAKRQDVALARKIAAAAG